eukprot:scaffold21786_cov52-Phaeocystis_antarctica.AAC.1
MDEDIAVRGPWHALGRRGGGSCCRMVGSDPLVAYTSRWFRDGGAEIDAGWLGCAESSSDIRPERLGLRPGPSRVGDRTLKKLHRTFRPARCRADTAVQMGVVRMDTSREDAALRWVAARGRRRTRLCRPTAQIAA